MAQSKKQILLQALHQAGFLRLLIASQRNMVTILMLHGVTDPLAPSAWKPLRPQLTTKQLSYALSILAQYYKFVSLPEAAEMLAGTRPLVPNSLALTFDDGYRNNLAFALPILRQFKAPATIFLSTGNVTEQKPFWFDRLDYAVQSMSKSSLSRHGIPEIKEIDFSTREALTHSFLTFIRKSRKTSTHDTAMRSAMKNLTDRMEQFSGHGLSDIFTNDPWSGVLTWAEIQQAAPEVHFGSHGVDHPQLGLIPLDIAKRELIESREAIEFYTGTPCRYLAYPNGSFNKNVISLAKTCKYSAAVTTISGLNQSKEEMLTLRRFAFPQIDEPAGILAAVAGLSSQWKKLRTTRHDPHSGNNREIQ
jgi:peptidoglycan/xylan/chitin deacetylase (PgdA/CDA1 family)